MAKKKERDLRFRVIGDFVKSPSTLQEFVSFEDGHYSSARLDLNGLRKVYKEALKDIPAHKEYLFEGRWIHESKMGKRDRKGLEHTYVERKQVRVNPFSQLDGAVIELGNRAFDLMQLNLDLLSQRGDYLSIIETLQKEGLVTKI